MGWTAPAPRHRCAITWSSVNATTESSRPLCILPRSVSILPSTGFRFTASTPPEVWPSDEGCAAQRSSNFSEGKNPAWLDARKIPRDLHEDARDIARRKMKTKAFAKSRDERKRVEMRFAHLKTHHGFERMRLRGLSGARDEFHLAAIVQNLKTLALRTLGPPLTRRRASFA